jgi:hypothetical protein
VGAGHRGGTYDHQRRKGRCKECDKSDSDLIRCSTCDVKKSKEAFELRSDGELKKCCIKCQEVKSIYTENLRCEHGKDKSYCELCDGRHLCIHKKNKFGCAECQGTLICQHHKRKSRCALCNGTEVCIHKKYKLYCRDCNFNSYLRNNIMSRMRLVLGYSDFSYLGCSIEEYIVYLESQFGDKFTWQNYGETWEVDHIKGIRIKGIRDEERIKRIHYLNTRPLSIVQ